MRYAWQICPNQLVMVLHVDIRLPYVLFSGFHEEELDAEDRDFVKNLRDIDGVVEISMFGKYDCMITRAELFTWADIKPQVVECFRKRYKPHGQLVDVGDREPIPEPRGYDPY